MLLVVFVALVASRAWPQDGSRIVFAGSKADSFTNLYMTTPDGASYELLTRVSEYPAWSRDGRTIALSSISGGPERLYLMDADGGNMRPITDGPDDWRPTWSPDGGSIAFASGREGRQRVGIYVADLATGVQTRLTGMGMVATHPCWRPGGGSIVYVSNREGAYDLHIMDEQGRHLTQLTDTPIGDANPDWHPREDVIAFSAADTVDEDGEVTSNIYTIRADGSGEQRLTDHPASDGEPKWSPNGREILFMSKRDGGAALYIMDSRGRAIRRVTDDRFVRIWGSSWFDPKFPRDVSPVGKRAATWAWLRRLGGPGR